MIENISRLLENKAYKNIVTNVTGVRIYFTAVESRAYVIVMSDFTAGDEFTRVQYRNILIQIEKQFRQRGFDSVNLMSLICTDHVEKARDFCEEDEFFHWIVNQKDRCLVIYENQNSDFLNVKELLEGILVGKLYNVEMKPNTDNGYAAKSGLPKWAGQRRIKKIAFEIKRRNLPVCTTTLVVANIIIFLLGQAMGNHEAILDWGASYYPDIMDRGEVYRLISHMFLHVNIEHLLGNMLVLFFIGERLESIVGKIKYLFMYFGAGILAGIGSMSYNMIQGDAISSVGASGAIFGVIGAMAYIVVVNRGRISDITPARIILFVFLSLYSGFSNPVVDNSAHIVGFFAGILIALILYRRTSKSHWNRM